MLHKLISLIKHVFHLNFEKRVQEASGWIIITDKHETFFPLFYQPLNRQPHHCELSTDSKMSFQTSQTSEPDKPQDAVTATDSSLRTVLKCKQANQSESSAGSDQGLTTTRLCSTETHAVFSDFLHFQAGSVDFELIVVKR